ncbi:TOM1-like protein 5 [Beta vulgaris subsp. vulgaris]|uniref:TOM1-like protein 5 n=1 Tax=Beta vulgaris subsp. vulgaris TaxID=3555 RepID=UPI002036B6A0|nr:TOM1-like protein 5 [Beta vulgaris subsp. vulgaris]XP_010675158.2 TOM1-like protein 5 [Beta vulgaris subsp. vulgaris]
MMASELVNSATSDKLAEVDWAKNIEICEIVANDQRQAKDVIKAIKKRLGSKSSNSQLFAVMLLEMLMNNIGDAVHKLVIEAGLLPVLVKIVKKKSDLPVRERIFLLLDATQTSVGGASGKFPQYYNAYYELVSAGVKFPQRHHPVSADPISSDASHSNLTVATIASASERGTKREESHPAPGSSIIEKARAALEVLREVLDAVNAQNPEAAKDEFTLDLVEQCSFQKDRVMHLVMSSRDEKLVSQAIELNEQLDRVLARHAALLSHGPATTANNSLELPEQPTPTLNNNNHMGDATWVPNHNNYVGKGTWASNHTRQPTSSPNHINRTDREETDEEEEAAQLSHRIRKGKALVRPEDEESTEERPFGLLGSSIPKENLHRPLIRPLTLKSPSPEKTEPPAATLIPPPPAKHVEREKFFQEKKGDGAALSGHMRSLSLHSRNASGSSYTGSIGSCE